MSWWPIVLLVTLAVLGPLYGADTRDGRDWAPGSFGERRPPRPRTPTPRPRGGVRRPGRAARRRPGPPPLVSPPSLGCGGNGARPGI